MEVMDAKPASRESFDDYLAWLNLQGEMGVWRSNRVKLDFVFRRLGNFLKAGMAVCDIGLGEGYTLNKLYSMGMKPSGIDISSYAIDYLNERFKKEGKSINLKAGDIAAIDLQADRFNAVTCFDILEHIPVENLPLAIINIKKSLKNGGFLIGTLPYKEVLDENRVVCPECGTKFHRYGHHHSFQSMNDIRSMLGADFEIIKSGDVPYCWFKSEILNQLGTAALLALKNLAGKNSRTTVYFVARLRK